MVRYRATPAPALASVEGNSLRLEFEQKVDRWAEENPERKQRLDRALDAIHELALSNQPLRYTDAERDGVEEAVAQKD